MLFLQKTHPMRCIAAIPARYNANRFPGKLMQTLQGKTLIRITYEKISSMKLFDDIIVVTDSEIIHREMKIHGAKVSISQKEHPTGTDRIAEIAQDLKADIIVNVQGDEPFIKRKSLESLLKIFDQDVNEDIQLSTLAYSLKNPLKIQNPHIVKVVVDKYDFALYFSRAVIPAYRENISKTSYLGHIGVYAFRKKALMNFTKFPILSNEKAESLECLRFLEHGSKIKIVRTTYDGVGIDTPEDLELAQKKFFY